MPTEKNAVWAELIQLLPVVSLALPFIVQGSVDLQQAASGFVVAALLTLPATAWVVARKQLLNPILVGTGLWLWLGAAAFYLPIEPIARWLKQSQAFGLFAAALGAGAIATWFSPHGYVACRTSDNVWRLRASSSLLGFTALALGWSWVFRHDIRLGGGLPFIALNVARRALCLRAPA